MQNYLAPPDLLKEKVILVTGAGQGIGRSAALTFAAHGATVILHGRNVEKLEETYDEIENRGYPQAAIFPLDLAKATDQEFEGLAQAIHQQLGGLDGILHNASAFYNCAPLEIQTLDQWLTLLRVNLAAPFALTKACLPLLKRAEEASVVMTSETHGHNPAAYWGGFAVSKSGVESLVRIWSEEWEVFPNLRINALIPGPVASPQRAKSHPGELKQSLRTPDDLMPYYLYLMGRDSRGTSGEIIECTGTGA